MQYGWALEYPNSNVYSKIGPGNFLITQKGLANNKQLTWSIFVYFIYYETPLLYTVEHTLLSISCINAY